MKVRMEFDLPSEDAEFRSAVDGWRFEACLDGMDEWLRSKIKWEDQPIAAIAAFREAREFLAEERSESMADVRGSTIEDTHVDDDIVDAIGCDIVARLRGMPRTDGTAGIAADEILKLRDALRKSEYLRTESL